MAIQRSVRRPEEAATSDPVFIPLGWPRLHEGKFYSSSDPEWREFVRISQDGRKLESLKGIFPASMITLSKQCSLAQRT